MDPNCFMREPVEVRRLLNLLLLLVLWVGIDPFVEAKELEANEPRLDCRDRSGCAPFTDGPSAGSDGR